ncbi:MAG: DUF2214 domain-containing protein [Xanthobacteraceae bacterium]
MDDILTALAQSSVASYFRSSRWGYAALNAAHIFGIGLLVGSTIPLSLRLLGLWPTVGRPLLARILVPTAAVGLTVALSTGVLLFSVRAGEYAGLLVFRIKLSVIFVGIASAVLAHLRYGIWLDRSDHRKLPEVGLVSILCWTSALVAGRLIAFVQ